MKRLSRIFLTGLLALVPLALTVMLLIWVGRFAETMLGGLLKLVLPAGWYVPGEGLLLGLVLVFLMGLLLQSNAFQWLFGQGESLLERVPLIKSVYGPLREMVALFKRGDREIGKPVLVRLPWNDNAMLGFLTQDQVSDELGGDDMCAVFLPMSYQIGGFMVLLAKDQIEPLSMSAQDALRFAFTSGMGSWRSKGTPTTDRSDALRSPPP